MSKVRGLVVQSRIEFLENNYDRAKLNEVLAELSDTVRQAIGEQVFPTSLYSFERLQELDNAIISCIDKPAEEIFDNIGAYHAKRLVGRYFFNYSENQQPHKLLAQIGRLYDALWGFGKYEYEKTGDRSARLSFEFYEDIHQPFFVFLKSFFVSALHYCGGEAARATGDCSAKEGQEFCEIIVEW